MTASRPFSRGAGLKPQLLGGHRHTGPPAWVPGFQCPVGQAPDLSLCESRSCQGTGPLVTSWLCVLCTGRCSSHFPGVQGRPSAPSPSNTTVLGDTGLKAATELTWPVGGPRACVASVLCITGHSHLRVSPFPARAVGRQGREGPRGLELPVRPVHTGPLRERDRRDRPPHGSGPRTLPAAGAFGKDGFVRAVCTRPTWVLTGRGLGKGKAPDAGLARAAV